MNLNGKVALVTGSSQGIGQAMGTSHFLLSSHKIRSSESRCTEGCIIKIAFLSRDFKKWDAPQAIATRLAQEGASIVINYRSHPEGTQETLDKVQAAGGKCHMAQSDMGTTIQADLGQVREVERLIGESIEHFGELDILVNNAGLEQRADFGEVSEEEYDKVVNVNLEGVFFATQTFVKHLKATGRPGKIINVSSVHEELPFPHFTTYCINKGGVKMVMRNLAVELGPFGITVNNVAPGAIETPINQDLLNDKEKLNAMLKNIPLRRLGKPEDVANLVAFLASSESDYTTGSTFYVDGGLLWNYQEQWCCR